MAEALRRIAAEAEARTGKLDLNNLGLDTLPEALFALTHLRELDLGSAKPWAADRKANRIAAQAGALARLAALETLSVAGSHLDNLAAVGSLARLARLDCSRTQIADLTPLAGLTALQRLTVSGCRLDGLPRAVLALPRLRKLHLYDSDVPGIPNEVLSQEPDDNCLERLRAYVAGLDAGEVAADARLLILGNGRVGKTQIARWLAGEPYDDSIETTHGIQLGRATLPGEPALDLQVWDFGGQDIYHSTHTLFLRNPAILLVAWAAPLEPDVTPHYTLGGLAFRNHPLAYWAEIARHYRHRASPVLFVQTQCDTSAAEVRPFPIRPETRAALAFQRDLHVSAKERQKGSELVPSLERAVTELRDPTRLGVPMLGVGWMQVQRALEARRTAGERWIDQATFAAHCAAAPGAPPPEHLLVYLDRNGTVFHRRGLFEDRIVLDQGWALAAIYAVFDRDGCYQQIVSQGGRFSRWLLGLAKWREYKDAEQKLLLSMMRSCGICFLHRRAGMPWDDDPHDEYIAPDLLPERDAVEQRLPALWDDAAATEQAAFTYPLPHDALIRGVMAEIGETAGQDALYWRRGLCGFEAGTRSRLRIELADGDGMRSVLTVRTQHGAARDLLARLVELVERVQDGLGLRPETIERPAPREPPPAPAPLRIEQEKPAMSEWFVSYAWGDDKSAAGLTREEKVDALCETAVARGSLVHRDRGALRPGDSIEAFMRRIGAGDRVFVFLSDKYLRSAFCMFELCEVWRHSRQEAGLLRERLRLWTLDDADIWGPVGRAGYARYWREKHAELAPHVQDLGGRDLLAWQRMRSFHHEVGDILATIADTVLPRHFEDFLAYGFDDAPP